jgi:hypothetical protein
MMSTGMYKNLIYNSEFIANNNFLTLGLMLFETLKNVHERMFAETEDADK